MNQNRFQFFVIDDCNIKQKLQAQFADPVAEDYLVKMLDAVSGYTTIGDNDDAMSYKKSNKR